MNKRICQFVYIHPFEDGNGRTCRLLTALLFLRHTYLINKYFVLDDYYDIDREGYSDSLHAADAGDLSTWLEYFTDGLKHSLQSSLGKIESGLSRMTIDLRPTAKEQKVLEIVKRDRHVFSYNYAHMSVLTIYTDGGSLNNPGQAAIGVVILKDNKQIKTISQPIGIASNNVAEYTALITALHEVTEIIKQDKTIERIQCFADSNLMVSQVNGLWKVKHADMKDLLIKIRMLESEIPIRISYTHVLRDKNKVADSLVKKALNLS